MVQLHSNRQKDHLCHEHCRQRTSQEDKLNYLMSAKSEESTVIQSKVMRVAHFKAFWTPKIGLPGMVTWIIQMTAKIIAWQMSNFIYGKTMASMIRNIQTSGMGVLCQIFPDWFDQHGSQRHRLQRCWWRSTQLKQEGVWEWRQSRTACINVSPASLCNLTWSFRYRYIVGEWWAVACSYWLINRCIAGAMNLLPRNMNVSCVRLNSASMLLPSALPQGPVSICQKDNH